MCNSMPTLLFYYDIIYEMIPILRITLKADFLLKYIEDTYENNWLGRLITFTNIA